MKQINEKIHELIICFKILPQLGTFSYKNIYHDGKIVRSFYGQKGSFLFYLDLFY